MRIPRSYQLHTEEASVHMFWRCHNKEFYLAAPRNKSLYMQTIKDSLKQKEIHNNVFVHAFCVMSNHYHQTVSYKENSAFLSNYMRYAHGLFGMRYNKNHRRSGKVAESRPKTSLIEDRNHEMRVHFYIEANPIRARICKLENLKSYKFNSYRFYAFGIEDENTELLTMPDWYLELGKNPTERQRRYRALFRDYLNETENNSAESDLYKKSFIGSLSWSHLQVARISNLLKQKRQNTS